MYTITGSNAASDIEIFEVNQSTGTIGGYQKQGMTGEFYSTYDSGNVYGSCRYYANSNSQFSHLCINTMRQEPIYGQKHT